MQINATPVTDALSEEHVYVDNELQDAINKVSLFSISTILMRLSFLANDSSISKVLSTEASLINISSKLGWSWSNHSGIFFLRFSDSFFAQIIRETGNTSSTFAEFLTLIKENLEKRRKKIEFNSTTATRM